MASPSSDRFFAPWFAVFFGVVVIGGLVAGSLFWAQYDAVVDDPERSEQLLRFIVVSYGIGPVLLGFRWAALKGRR